MKTSIKLLLLPVCGLIFSCSDPFKKFEGKHELSIPYITTNYDSSKTVSFLGMSSHPSYSYYDLYTQAVEFYKSDGKLSGQIKFHLPERPSEFDRRLKYMDKIFPLNSLRILNDTLKFLFEAEGFLNKSSFEGFAYEDHGVVMIGIPKNLLKIKHFKVLTNIQRTSEFDIVKSNATADKKAFYKYQADSLKGYIEKNSNASFINSDKKNLEYLLEMTK